MRARYYPASAAGGAVSSFTMTLTSVADLMEQRHRATAVGYLTSCFSLGMLAGPLLGGYLSVTTALWTCIALTAVTWLYVAAVVPECAPGPLARRRAAKATAAAAADSDAEALVPPKADSATPVQSGQGSQLGVADGGGGGGGEGGKGREDEQEENDLEGSATAEAEAEAEALAAAEAVSLVSAQRHLMSGAAAPSAAADADVGVPGACAVYGAACCVHTRVSTCGGNGGDDDEAMLPYRRRPRRSSAAGDGGSGGFDGCVSSRLAGLSTGWSVIRRSSFYRRIAAIWVVVAMTWEGAGELLMQYLQFKLGFNTLDQAHVLTVLASGGLIVKLGLLALMVRWLGEQRLLALGLAAYAAECVALAAAPTKAAGLAAVSIGSLASVCWPALTALQTAGVDPTQQGAVFGALQAISSMASGLGPLVFAAVFRQVTRSDSGLAPMPGVVWYLAAAMTAVAIGLALSLPEQPQHVQQHQHQHPFGQEGPAHAAAGKGSCSGGACGRGGCGQVVNGRPDVEEGGAGRGCQAAKAGSGPRHLAPEG
ncbi:hypothetical protein Vretifemale_15204, partial [Volvox reticuliferus]